MSAIPIDAVDVRNLSQLKLCVYPKRISHSPNPDPWGVYSSCYQNVMGALELTNERRSLDVQAVR